MTETTIGWAPQPGTEAALIADDVVKVFPWTPADDGVLEEAQSLTAVADAADYEYAAGLVVRLRFCARAAESYYKPFKQAIDAIKRKVLDREYKDASAYDHAASRLDQMARAWMTAKAAKERAEREAAEAAQRAEDERLRQETVARLKRAAEQVPDSALQTAINLEAQQLAAAPLATTKVTHKSAIPAVRGYVPTVVTYSAVCDDLMLLVKAVAEGTVPLDALEVNQARINKAAVDSKEALRWPGVRVVKTEGSRTRG